MGEAAMEDITVYKVMVRNDDGLCSYVQGYQYEAGEEYRLGKKLSVDYGINNFVINEGFHSYDSECGVYVELNTCTACSPVKDTKHECYYTLQRYSEVNIINIVECIIPKGSVYFKNTGGEIVSDKIRITGKIASYYDLIDENIYKVVRFQDIFAN